MKFPLQTDSAIPSVRGWGIEGLKRMIEGIDKKLDNLLDRQVNGE